MPTFLDKYNGNVIIIEKSAILSLGPKQFLRLLGSYFSILRQRNFSLGRHFARPLSLQVRLPNSAKSLVRGQI